MQGFLAGEERLKNLTELLERIELPKISENYL